MGVQSVAADYGAGYVPAVPEFAHAVSSPPVSVSRIIQGALTNRRLAETQALARLCRLNVPVDRIDAARRRAWANGTTVVQELISAGDVGEDAYFRRLAVDLGLPFAEQIDPECLILFDRTKIETVLKAGTVRCLARDGGAKSLMAPTDVQALVLSGALAKSPGLAKSIQIAAPGALERALTQKFRRAQARETVNALPYSAPDFCANKVLAPNQAYFLGVLSVLTPVVLLSAFKPAVLALHVMASLLFAACVLLRLRAAGSVAQTERPPFIETSGPFPVYSIIIALYKEAAVVPQLCSHLAKLNWPASRLEILFACEESDMETIQALGQAPLLPNCKIITVPAFGPQTKPRALSFALPLTRGEFVVIYDAEDRPHPEQLMEAYCRFQREPNELACLQSPLVITNQHGSWLSRMFAFEYAALFRGLLPFLASKSRFIPLGGTSNHFRRSVLVDVCGWDPYNVTEDADLGTRLLRLGYRAGTLCHPTLEDAPSRLAQWLPQRTRWFKGWMQTWLVHMRHPVLFLREVGTANFACFQILTAGLIASALIYPVMLVEMLWQGLVIASSSAYGLTDFGLLIFVIDFANVALGHLGFLRLGVSAGSGFTRAAIGKVIFSLPFYWLLLSLAAWRALWQLSRNPHHWEKSEHFPTAVQV